MTINSMASRGSCCVFKFLKKSINQSNRHSAFFCLVNDAGRQLPLIKTLPQYGLNIAASGNSLWNNKLAFSTAQQHAIAFKLWNSPHQMNSIKYPSNYFATSVGNPQDDPEKKPSLYQRFKKMAKEYWYVLVPVHIVTSAFWLGGFYYLAITGVDIVKLMELIGLPDSWVTTMRGSKAGGIVTAYTLYKVATPARYTVTLGGTTVTINYLTKWGLIKPMPSQAELRTIYENKKEAYRDLKRSYTEKMTAAAGEIKDEFKKTRDDITQQMTAAKSGVSTGFKSDIEGLKEGVSGTVDELRHVGKLVKQRTIEAFHEDRGEKPIQAKFKGVVCHEKPKKFLPDNVGKEKMKK